MMLTGQFKDHHKKISSKCPLSNKLLFPNLNTFRHEFSFRLKIVLYRCCMKKILYGWQDIMGKVKGKDRKGTVEYL